MVGKWHLSMKSTPIDRGFDEFYGMLRGIASFFQEKPAYRRHPVGRAERKYEEGEFYSTDAFGDYALDFFAGSRRRQAVVHVSRI